jgi:PAS domain S-box-containing protein
MRTHIWGVSCGPAACLALLGGLLLLPAGATAGPVKNVVIVHGESPDLPGPRLVVDAIQSTLRRESPDPVEFYVETVDTGHFEAAQYEQRLADLLAEKYRDIHVDLVISFAAPAVNFVLREHERLFPGAAILLGLVERRMMAGATLPPKTSIVYVELDPYATVRLALRTLPSTRRLLIVGGTSRFDRGWQTVVREQLRTSDAGVQIDYDTDSPLDALLTTVASLPEGTAVFYLSVTRDGADAPHRALDVLDRLREVSRVPIYAVSSTFLGHGIVGGVLIDFAAHGEDLARRSVQLLRGEVPAPSTTATVTSVDWREMQRFGISAAALPPSTVIAFRPPGLWERYRLPILLAGFVISAEGALILTLVRLARRRRETQLTLERRLRFQHRLSDLALALTATPPKDIAPSLDAALVAMAAGIGIPWVWRWSCGLPDDADWSVPELDLGRPAVFSIRSELPPTILAKLDPSARSVVAVPLLRDGVMVGALVWASPEPLSSWPVRPDDLQMVATIVGNVLQRREAEAALHQGDRLKGAILDSLPAHVAVLDRDGTIIAVNDSWLNFGDGNGLPCGALVPAGGNYRAVCAATARLGVVAAADAVALIDAACRGEQSVHQLEYRCDGPDSVHWYAMRAAPLRREEGGAVVTHSDITTRKLNEIALRESEARFRRLADALPVAIWMSEADGLCTYFNKQWLKMTGRTLQEESGRGWLGGVHPDDRERCEITYLDAFRERTGFTMDYRIRQGDGQYRWLLDAGEPRYGTDGAFHGFVGGCIDITERRDAEQMLRDLNRRLIMAQEEERRHIARELHDHLNQQLALLAIDLQQLAHHLPEVTDTLVDALEQAWQRTCDIASDVHGISHRLHPSKLEALGLAATIRGHCRDLSRQALKVRFSDEGNTARIPPDVSLCLFRIVEESLSNVARHSAASEAEVSLVDADTEIVLRVSDTGRGFTISPGGANGIGLVSMRERLQALGGTLTITSKPGEGTTVEARVPRAGAAQPVSIG